MKSFVLHSQLLGKIGLLSCSLVLSLILGEVFLRLFSDLLSVEIQQVLEVNPRNFGVSHFYIGNLHTPNNTFILSGRDFRAAHNTDGYGFRNAWPWPKRAEIVALGDSVTFGQAVDDDQAWPAVLARSLPGSRIINLGLIGAGPQQYLRVYETFGITLRPTLLLVGLFARNDFWDDDMFDRWLRSGAGGNYMVWRDFGRPKRVGLSLDQPIGSLIGTLQWRSQLIARKSHLYNLLLYVLGIAKPWNPGEVTYFQLADGTRLELLSGDFRRKAVAAHPGRPEFELTLDAFGRIRSIAESHGTKLLVILQPSKEETYLPLVDGDDVPDMGGPLREELEKMGTAYLDLGPAFRERAAKGEKLFFEADGHPNDRGYALVAERVISHLKDNAKRYGLKDWEKDSSKKE